MKLYIVIQSAGYADPEEIRGVFSTEALAEAARKKGERIDIAELDIVYPHGTDPEHIELRNKPIDRDINMTPAILKAIKQISGNSPWMDLLK